MAEKDWAAILKTRIVLLQTLTAGSGITATPWRV